MQEFLLNIEWIYILSKRVLIIFTTCIYAIYPTTKTESDKSIDLFLLWGIAVKLSDKVLGLQPWEPGIKFQSQQPPLWLWVRGMYPNCYRFSKSHTLGPLLAEGPSNSNGKDEYR